MTRDEEHGDYHVATVLDAFSDKRYDVFWDDNGKPRRIGDAALLLEISHSRGFAMVMPFKAGYLFTILGDASRIPAGEEPGGGPLVQRHGRLGLGTRRAGTTGRWAG